MAFMEVLLTGKGRRKLAIALAVFQSFFVLCALAVTLIGLYLYITLDGFARNLNAKQNIYLSKLMMIGGLVVAVFHLYCAYLCMAVTNRRTRQRFFRALVPTAIVYFGVIWAIFSVAVSCFVEKAQIRETIGKSFKLAMYRYKADSRVKVILDKLQMSYRCCGADNYTNWFQINWVNHQLATYEKIGKNSVPFSCCDPHSPRPCVHIDVTRHSQMYKYNPKKDITLYKDGCKKAIVHHTLHNTLIPTGIGVFIWFFLELLGWLAFRILQTSLYTAMTWGKPDAPSPGWVSTLGGAMPLTTQKEVQDVESQSEGDDPKKLPIVTDASHVSHSRHDHSPNTIPVELDGYTERDRDPGQQDDLEHGWDREREWEPEPEHERQSEHDPSQTLPVDPTRVPVQQKTQQPSQDLTFGSAQQPTPVPVQTPAAKYVPVHAQQVDQNLTFEPVQHPAEVPVYKPVPVHAQPVDQDLTFEHAQHPADVPVYKPIPVHPQQVDQDLARGTPQMPVQGYVPESAPGHAQQPARDLVREATEQSFREPYREPDLESARGPTRDHTQHHAQQPTQERDVRQTPLQMPRQTPRQTLLKSATSRRSSIRLIHAKMETSSRQKGGAAFYQVPAPMRFPVSGRFQAPTPFSAIDGKIKKNLFGKPKKWDDDDENQRPKWKNYDYQTKKDLEKRDRKVNKKNDQNKTKEQKPMKEEKQKTKSAYNKSKKETKEQYKKREQEKKKVDKPKTKSQAKGKETKERGRSKDKGKDRKQPESRSKSKSVERSKDKKGDKDEWKSKSGSSSRKSARDRSVSSSKGKSKTTSKGKSKAASKSKSSSKSRSPRGKSPSRKK